MTINESIAMIAAKYIGFQETPNNSGFKDKEFEQRMKDVGWDKGMAWCTFFCELVWKEAYSKNDEIKKRLTELFSGSATTTYKNFDLNKLFKTSPDTPVVGAIAIYRHGSGWQGHAGIVVKTLENATDNVEGNSNDKGGRDGYIVTPKNRKIIQPYKPTGLNLVGFIHPMQ